MNKFILTTVITLLPVASFAHEMISITKIIPEYDYYDDDTESYSESEQLISINKDLITIIQPYSDGYDGRYEVCLASGECFIIDENTRKELE